MGYSNSFASVRWPRFGLTDFIIIYFLCSFTAVVFCVLLTVVRFSLYSLSFFYQICNSPIETIHRMTMISCSCCHCYCCGATSRALTRYNTRIRTAAATSAFDPMFLSTCSVQQRSMSIGPWLFQSAQLPAWASRPPPQPAPVLVWFLAGSAGASTRARGATRSAVDIALAAPLREGTVSAFAAITVAICVFLPELLLRDRSWIIDH